MSHAARGQQVHLVTQARRPMSEDISYRQHRYLIMMGIRVVCFAIAIILFVEHLRWLVLPRFYENCTGCSAMPRICRLKW